MNDIGIREAAGKFLSTPLPLFLECFALFYLSQINLNSEQLKIRENVSLPANLRERLVRR